MLFEGLKRPSRLGEEHSFPPRPHKGGEACTGRGNRGIPPAPVPSAPPSMGRRPFPTKMRLLACGKGEASSRTVNVADYPQQRSHPSSFFPPLPRRLNISLTRSINPLWGDGRARRVRVLIVCCWASIVCFNASICFSSAITRSCRYALSFSSSRIRS